ncbi:MAG: hypothetical protein CMB80_28620 [Flammeovirgaceae bacterium]|nr:hypothetical protein [Flammeovirgaceae bacterium]
MTLREEIESHNPHSIVWEPDYLDNAIVGISTDGIVIYDYDKLADIFVKEGKLSYEEAYDHLGFNLCGSYLGDFTPIQIRILRRNNNETKEDTMAVCQ